MDQDKIEFKIVGDICELLSHNHHLNRGGS